MSYSGGWEGAVQKYLTGRQLSLRGPFVLWHPGGGGGQTEKGNNKRDNERFRINWRENVKERKDTR